MFRDRDLLVLAAGAVAGVLTLFLPFSLVVRAMIAGAVFVFFMVIALVRIGPDRVPVEQFLKRRFRYARAIRRYVYQRQAPAAVEAPQETAPAPPPPPAPVPARPVVFAVDEVGVEPLLTAGLVVLTAYLTYWLVALGGGHEMAGAVRQLFR